MVKITEENDERKELNQLQKFIVELIIMIIVGLLVIVPFILYEYHLLL